MFVKRKTCSQYELSEIVNKTFLILWTKVLKNTIIMLKIKKKKTTHTHKSKTKQNKQKVNKLRFNYFMSEYK